ncbi:MAG: ARPP-1 family domain-containing protein [Gaiellaceae bacterium]
MIQSLIQIGEPVEHRGIVVAPLFPRRDPVAAYITLDEALSQGLRIAETSESGSVPELVVENPLAERVLLYDGEELVGAKQNRILNVSVLVDAKSSLTIPVSCVEQGRWSRRSAHFATAPHISHAELRRRKAESQAARPLARGVAQGEVWDAVRDKSVRMQVSSQTGASSDIHRAYERDIRALEDAFAAQPGQCGALLAIGGDLCLDAVSRPDAFARLWPKLRAGYLLDALERLDGKPTPRESTKAFVDAIGGALTTRQPSAGLGEDVRLRGERIVGSGLELDGELIQLSAFRSEDGGQRAFGRIARPSRRS